MCHFIKVFSSICMLKFLGCIITMLKKLKPYPEKVLLCFLGFKFSFRGTFPEQKFSLSLVETHNKTIRRQLKVNNF